MNQTKSNHSEQAAGTTCEPNSPSDPVRLTHRGGQPIITELVLLNVVPHPLRIYFKIPVNPAKSR